MEYYIYHIPKVKIGCTNNINKRIRQQGFTDYEVLEIHTDIDVAGQREFELQKQYGYKVDSIRYSETVKRGKKGREISALTKHEWLPKVDWKAREEKIDNKTKWEKVKSSSAYINMDRSAIGFKAQAKRKKTILQYDLDGNFIKEFNCGAKNMPDEYKNAGGCAKTNTGTLYGYQWRYKEGDKIPNKIGKFTNKLFKKIIQLDKIGNEIKIWDNQTLASNEIGISVQAISQCIKGKSKTAGGYKWKTYEK